MTIDRMRIEAVGLLKDMGWDWDGVVWQRSSIPLNNAGELHYPYDDDPIFELQLPMDEMPARLRDAANVIEFMNENAGRLYGGKSNESD